MSPDGTVRWRARAGDLVSFSPDGTKVLAVLAPSRLSVLHARTGETTTIDLPAGADLEPVVWGTDKTLLTLLRLDGKVGILRLRLDGRTERATPPPLDLIDSQSAYVLVEHPPTEA